MKKRILSIILLCCMVLTLLPTAVFAAETGTLDTIPTKFDVEIDLCYRTSDINIKDSKTYYIYSSSSDPDFVWTKKIQINGKKAAPHIFLDNVNIQVNKDAKTPAIELHGKASAYLYFINRDSKLTGATGRAAIQKNRSEGQLCVQVMEGTTVTCQGGYKAAGIGGSWATRNIAESLFNLDMYGHGANMHFGSQTNPSLWSGTIIAKGGDGGAGIGGGRNGSGEKLYFYSGKIEAKGGEAASGIGGSFKGRGRDIYIYGGDISAKGGDGGAGIGGGCWKSLQDMDGDTAAYNINIYGGKINAHGGYNGAGIGGGQYVPARDITITGGEITAHGTHGAAIGGGRWCHGQNITVTDAKLKLTTGYSRYISDEAAAMGYGDRVYLEKVYDIDVGKRYIGDLVRNPLPEDYKSIKIGSYHGKLVKLKVEAQAINRDDEFALFWNLYDILIPNENGRIDVQLLTLPYVKNYGWAIEAMEMELIDDPCNGKHDFGWVDRQSCHVWACRNMKCQARDPVAEMSKQNGKHIPGDWSNQKQLCTVCGHVMGTDTKAPVLEGLKDGESYTVEDTLDGNPGAYTFTVSDPALNGETSSGIKSVTINGEPQDGPTYRLPAPDGGNNDAGAKYTVVATDNAGNETTATVRTYKAIPHTHTYDQEIQKPETLKSAADCTNDAVYFKSCSCGEISTTETFTAAGTQLGHAWASDWSKDTDNHWKECSRCHEKKDEAAHDYGSDNICDTCGYDKTVPHTHNLTLVPAKAPTCTEKGNTAYYTCDGCDKWFEDATGASEITDKTSVILAATGHSASDWKSDNTDHWKECTVVGCGVIIEGSKAAHTAGEWIIDTPATATTSGSKHKECTVCGYTMATETIPATGGGEHTHSYGSEWKNDADNHWHECSCGDKKDTAAHTAGEWIIDTPATATTDGSKHKECTVCKRVLETGTIPAIGSGEHTHNYSSDWKSDSINHWKECSCGDKADVAAHSFKWVVDKEATATKKGSKHEECKVCGYQRPAVEIPATGTPTEPTDPTKPTNPSKPDDTTKPGSTNGSEKSPQTGDNSNMMLWFAVLFVSGFGVLGTVIYGKKKKEQAE